MTAPLQQADGVLHTQTSWGKRSVPNAKWSSPLTVQLWIVIQGSPNSNKDPIVHGSHPKINGARR